VVENRGGATGNIGTVAVVNAAPDGCTLLVNATIIATSGSFQSYPTIRSGPSLRSAASVSRRR
jgi:tripartite-type tricarboxylate transporter receptor subunit TctC